MLGLVKHLTFVEVTWFQWSFAGIDMRLPSGELEPGDTIESVLAAYCAATPTSSASSSTVRRVAEH